MQLRKFFFYSRHVFICWLVGAYLLVFTAPSIITSARIDASAWQAFGAVITSLTALAALLFAYPQSIALRRRAKREEIAIQVYESFNGHNLGIGQLMTPVISRLRLLVYLAEQSRRGRFDESIWESYVAAIIEDEAELSDALRAFWAEAGAYLHIYPDLVAEHTRVIGILQNVEPDLEDFLFRMRSTQMSAIDADVLAAWAVEGRERADRYGDLRSGIDGFVRSIFDSEVSPIIEGLKH